jgi:Flp pilus assembly protein protease CpaA
MWVQETQTWLWVPLEKNVELILTCNLYGLIEIMGFLLLSANQRPVLASQSASVQKIYFPLQKHAQRVLFLGLI